MIEKKTWMPYFQYMLDRDKNVEVRVASFRLKEGESILFREWDQNKGEYTGRTLIRQVKHLFKVRLTDFNPVEDILFYGHYVMELE